MRDTSWFREPVFVPIIWLSLEHCVGNQVRVCRFAWDIHCENGESPISREEFVFSSFCGEGTWFFEFEGDNGPWQSLSLNPAMYLLIHTEVQMIPKNKSTNFAFVLVPSRKVSSKSTQWFKSYGVTKRQTNGQIRYSLQTRRVSWVTT